ncbi:hypothetical protein O0L34_g15598 [Tuta absoluta]|nr:hypothetical protein O0L34_g15598 [Tuta absoluta]
MTEYYHIVPWFSSKEWHLVYENIYSSTSSVASQQEALNFMLIWKARCPSLPSGVESTLTLLEVHLQDAKNSDDVANQQLLRLAYSSALMRFVNHMLDIETAKGTSLYQAAKNLGVPDWIIDLRHDTAHSNNLPSTELLREACTFSLDWLQKQYWDKQKLHIRDYTAGQTETNSNDENKITALVNFCVSLSICANPKNKIKNLSEIVDIDMRESIVNDTRDLFGDQVDLSNLKTVSVMGLINLLNFQSKKLLKTKDAIKHVNKALLSEESLFLSQELLDYVSDGDLYSKSKLSKNYVQCFEVLLTFLHSNELIMDFVLELIKVSESCDNDYRSKLAALWVSEILSALKKSKNFIDNVHKMGEKVTGSKKKKELKLLFRHWFPNEKNTSLLLDLQKSVPYELTNINFIQPIISAYNPNLTFFIKDILCLVEPNLPKSTANKICTLAKLISSPDKFPVGSSQIFTVEDLRKAKDVSQNLMQQDIDSDSDVICEFDSRNYSSMDLPRNTIWMLAATDCGWSSCPIGILPWQQKANSFGDMDTN